MIVVTLTSSASFVVGCRKNLPLYGPNVLKKHQFTTRRLLANVTVLAVVLALVTAFPGVARAVTLLLLLYSPAILISAFAIWRSQKRTRTIPADAVIRVCSVASLTATIR